MGNTTNRQHVDWLRLALQNALEAAPVQGYAKKQANTLVQQMPEWLLLRWSEANGINSAAGCHSAPQLPEMLLTDTGRTQVKEYVETHRCVPLVRSLRRIVSAVTRLDAEGRLPCNYSEVVHATAAVAMGNRTVEGRQFLWKLSEVIGTPTQPDKMLLAYEGLLESANEVALSKVHGMLDCGYGEWVSARL